MSAWTRYRIRRRRERMSAIPWRRWSRAEGPPGARGSATASPWDIRGRLARGLSSPHPVPVRAPGLPAGGQEALDEAGTGPAVAGLHVTGDEGAPGRLVDARLGDRARQVFEALDALANELGPRVEVQPRVALV